MGVKTRRGVTFCFYKVATQMTSNFNRCKGIFKNISRLRELRYVRVWNGTVLVEISDSIQPPMCSYTVLPSCELLHSELKRSICRNDSNINRSTLCFTLSEEVSFAPELGFEGRSDLSLSTNIKRSADIFSTSFCVPGLIVRSIPLTQADNQIVGEVFCHAYELPDFNT